MKISHIHILIAILVIIGGGIGIASQMSLFETSRSAEPARLTEDMYDIADIRGSSTLKEVETYYQVPSEAIIEAFNLKPDINPSTFQLKDLKEIYQTMEIEGAEYAVETDTVKVFVSLFSDIPYTSEETFYLPQTAVNYLIRENKLAQEEEDYWIKHTFDLVPIEPGKEIAEVKEDTNNEPVNQEEEKNDISITGRMTIAEIITMEIDSETFKEITGLDVPEDKTVSIRDFITSRDLEFSVIKEKMEFFLSSNNKN
ncbi:MAG: hypothetical protein PHI72_06830 [Atribacterota bacterium]|nr:hypothetical protein [Atribacterota bacterium]MDD4896081.1 hypothetical protein [Atribacterota bacterium]MDD5637411.1 hypothetical protein [Atribacterota bacterium]